MKDSRPIIQFLLIVIVMYFGVDYLYQHFYLAPYALKGPGNVDPFTRMYSRHVVSFLSLFNINATMTYAAHTTGYTISTNGIGRVLIIPDCNGFPNLLLLFSFLLAFPGPVIKKIWYMPLALLLLYFCNVCRVGLLVITNSNDYSQYFKVLKTAVNLITHVSLLLIFIVWLKISLKK